jgi:hypothetical protein
MEVKMDKETLDKRSQDFINEIDSHFMWSTDYTLFLEDGPATKRSTCSVGIHNDLNRKLADARKQLVEASHMMKEFKHLFDRQKKDIEHRELLMRMDVKSLNYGMSNFIDMHIVKNPTADDVSDLQTLDSLLFKVHNMLENKDSINSNEKNRAVVRKALDIALELQKEADAKKVNEIYSKAVTAYSLIEYAEAGNSVLAMRGWNALPSVLDYAPYFEHGIPLKTAVEELWDK